MSKKVALFVGGWSCEREVSLNKGVYIEKALIEAGYDVLSVDVTKDLGALIKTLNEYKPDVVFNNLYGKGGEDGTIQAVLDIMEIPYTHSGVMASSVGMNKPMTRVIAEHIGIQIPKGVVAPKEDVMAEKVMPRPYVMKPIDEGSSVGVRVMLEGDNVTPLEAFKGNDVSENLLVEEYIPGREVHVTVLDGKAQGTTEVIVAGRFFDYEAKYADERTELQTPADIPEVVAQTAKEYAENIFNALGCEGLARCDFRYDNSKNDEEAVFFLEINTMPGLAPGSVALIQPESNGITFVQLCKHLVETASFGDNGRVTKDIQNLIKAHG